MNETKKEIISKLKELRNSNIVLLEEIHKLVKKGNDDDFLDRIMKSNCIIKTVKPHTAECNQGIIYLPKDLIWEKVRIEKIK